VEIVYARRIRQSQPECDLATQYSNSIKKLIRFTSPREMNLRKSIDTTADLSAKVVLMLKVSIMMKCVLQFETTVFSAFFGVFS
jgi:hypothetical protein